MKKFVYIILILALMATGCSEQKATSSLPDTHPKEWMSPDSPDFHGTALQTLGEASCIECHGADFNGGKVEISCIECHLTSGACASCHGGLEDKSGAPPYGLEGETADTSLAVGAHQLHLHGSGQSAVVPCEFCHLVPALSSDSGHYDMYDNGAYTTDSIAELTFSGYAGDSTVWDRTARSCSDNYCHGNFEGGNKTNAPIWNEQNQAECGSCHAVTENLEQLTINHKMHIEIGGFSCNICHMEVIREDMTFNDPSRHVNGVVNIAISDQTLCEPCHGTGGLSCTGCHGGIDNETGAPPKGLNGETLTSERAVGAHTAHLSDGTISDAFECGICHLYPSQYNSEAHIDGDNIAELTFNDLSGSESQWDRTTNSCTGTYCHGNFNGGLSDNAPIWTANNQAECGSCHAVYESLETISPLHQFHIVSSGLKCSDCHSTVVDDSYGIIDISLHVNGQLNYSVNDQTVCDRCHGPNGITCVGCHGGIDNETGAPPDGLGGETATTDRAVGAHTAHLSDGTLADAFECAICHIKPAEYSDPGHVDGDGIAELTFGSISGASSQWLRDINTCNDTYCHGNFNGGNNANAPIWTASNQADCGSCHDTGDNPQDLKWKHQFHITNAGLVCADCHAAVVDSTLNIIDLTMHVNGVADTLILDQARCDQCHGPNEGSCVTCHGGTDNLTGAPPKGIEGELLTSDLAVGAHTAHLEGGAIANGYNCNTCHIVPSNWADSAHIGPDFIAEITFNETIVGIDASWNRVAATCNDNYCHGNFIGGKTANAPIWNGSNQAVCGSCHDVGADPASLLWKHETHVTLGLKCEDCHAAVVDFDLNIINTSLHVNGVIDTSISDQTTCDLCHASGHAGCIGCHGGVDNATGAPPAGLEGELLTSELAVGAHTTHLEGAIMSIGFPCETCHLVPETFGDVGHYDKDSTAELTFSTLAGVATNWDRLAATCSDNYCHGNFRGGKLANTPVWTSGSSVVCGSCHDVGANPASLYDEHYLHVFEKNKSCAECHNTTVFSNNSFNDKSLHVNGINDVNFLRAPEGVYQNGSCSGMYVQGCHHDNTTRPW